MRKSWPAILIIVITFLTFAGVLGHEFLSWDDEILVTQNYLVRNFSPMIFWSYDPELYIPITLLSFQINYALFDLNPFWYHLTNLIIHISNALLVFWLSLMIIKKRYLAVFAALIFAVHPLNTEAVAWISARKELLSTFFMLSALITYVKTGDKRWMIVLSLILFVLAMMSKVTALVLPLILILYDQAQPKSENRNPKTYIPFLLLAGIFAVIAVVGKSIAVIQLTTTEMVLLAFRSTTFYLQKFLLPIKLSAIYGAPDPISIQNWEIIFSILIVALLITATCIFRKMKVAMFASGFAILTIAPSFMAYMKSDGISVAADRYAYMPSIGLAMLIVLIVSSIRKQDFVIFILVAVISSCMFLTIERNKVWATTEVLFQDIIKKNPTSHITHNNIGNMHLNNGDLRTALLYLEKAMELNPESPEVLVNMGVYYGKLGDYSASESYLNQAMEIHPTFAPAHFNKGGIHFQRREYRSAIESYKKAIESNRYYTSAIWQLARTYLKSGDQEMSRETYLGLLKFDESYKGRRAELDELIN
ncbi:MAG: tetratricopeptide repeat protein [Candidatus Peribacteraceae bacterium]|jgi:hypothetical protein|nr:tetratricopeptide repeat protein [Candidatus Peribacteraceae bacterium]MDP7645594.1 tetratricopeptide repeat protein [Candidatus Peribacteraceae bacterium]